MKRIDAIRALTLALYLTSALKLWAADVITIEYPYLGVTHITRVGSVPDFPRNVKINVVKIDLTASSLSFKFTPHSGTRDTVRETTLQYLNDMGAQIAINGSFFLPFPSTDLNAALVGFAASNGNVYSPFELPTQNYALVRDSPAINIDPNNHASIVHRDPAFSDGTCYGLCQAVDGLHILENVAVWNAFAGSGQIVTGGVKTIPCYVDATHPDCQLVGPGPANYSNSNSWYELINARTSIGLGCDAKTLVLFTVDNANGSSGMKVSEVADLLIRDYRVCNALNMDGGGSTSLAMADPVTGIGRFLNSSSDNPNGRMNASGLAVFAVRDTVPPLTTAQIAPPPNANGWNNNSVTVTLNAQDNPGGIVKQIQYSLTGAQTSGTQVVAGNTASFNVVAEGVTTVRYFATDVAGNSESTESLTVKIDETPPVISGMPATGCTLWPPNHKLVKVATVTAADALSGVASGSFTITGSSNEPTDPNDPAVVMTPNGPNSFIIQVLADRLGDGSGRIYTLTATAKDLAGNVASSTATCVVPHDQGK
ncbi:MAG TPA: phosphodiester glycosidase family protein [Bryobacteraceae bacterium]|nr:phosphodiester glycosidase family protein [Candidatus Acidoferrales bacterium]HTS28598.1 phosphodiester glycosidase family protein [Bryobacteraceae bacterium]